MKMNHFSQTRIWTVLSLALLSPVLQAASDEPLNFNYTRTTDALSLKPRLGLTARACHSLADPIDIKFEFGEMSAPHAIYLVLTGKDYTKGYAAFRPASGGAVSDALNDPDFKVAWGVHGRGTVKGTRQEPSPSVSESYNYPFCFAHGHPYNGNIDALNNTYGYWPVFRPDYFNAGHKDWQITTPDANAMPQDWYNWDQWNHYCSGRKTAADIQDPGKEAYIVWGDPKDNAPNNEIKHQVALNANFLTYNLFYVSHTPGKPAGSPLVPVIPYDSTFHENSYLFPIDKKSIHEPVYLENGHFSFRLDNRNITSMTLTIFSDYDKGYKSVWTWTRDGDNNALMHLTKTGNIGISTVSNQDGSDPYSISGFYRKPAQSHFKGTLVAKSSLNENFEKHVPPLSLPPATDGDINLANTDSLTFSMGQPKVQGGQGNWTLSVLGQPLKFAPLYINDKEAVSAMQMRNACY
ncbi:TPA: hypothetical protein PAP86_004007 [Salmonella enterica]|nr:hypothetical protein [Salmonella enterica]